MDRALGEALERGLRAHHRRRLGKIGWERVFDPRHGTALGNYQVRDGNDLRVFIDGEDSFNAIAAGVRGARSHVHLAGWHMEAEFVLIAEPDEVTLRELLAEAGSSAEVRVLVWGGAPLPPPFRPRRREANVLREQLDGLSGVTVALDSKERLLHCHHEKIVVIDDEVAFVGGLDFSTIGASRLDGSDHPPREPMGWHDATVELRGPIVADVADHFGMRWREVTGQPLSKAVAGPAGEVAAQIVRTVPEKVYGSLPNGEFGILEAYVKALQDAKEFIYLENQFLWSSEIVKLLAQKLSDPPSDDFRLLVLLPSRPATGKDDTLGQLAVLAEADRDNRFLACTLYGRDDGRAVPVYVHAKVGIVDDEWLTIGSGNLNNHSLFNDTEMNVVVRDEALARDTRLRLWAEHLEVSKGKLEDLTPTSAIDELWGPIARDQQERRAAGRPLTHRVARLPNVSKRAKRLLGPLQTFLVDG
ncbi:MAG: phospholipase D family protein [Actinomycetota bacterium]|nr:phospholipase D family protein [Actinomycetota bacterium]